MKQQAVSIASAMALMAVLAGCGAASTTGTPTAKSGSTVVVALPVQASPNWFVPVFSSNAFSLTNIQFDALMYKPLVYINKHDQVDYQKSLAESITYNTQGTEFTIHLNPKYRWSNGHAVTAKDILFTWDIMKAASSGLKTLPWNYGGAGQGGVPTDFKSVTAVNKSTVKILLNNPVSQTWFIHNGLSQINPIPASVWNKYPNNMTQELKYILSVSNAPTNPVYHVVDGAYRMASFSVNNNWTLTKNPTYGGHQGTVSKVIFQYETSASSEFEGLKTGTVSVGYIPMSMYTSRSQLVADNITQGYSWGMTYLQPNLNSGAMGGVNKILSQLPVRKALEEGINQPGIINTLFHGQGIEENSPVLSQPKTPFFDPALSNLTYPYNPANGKALLQANGWHEVNGVMTKGNEKLSFTLNYVSGSATVSHVVQLLKSSWAAEGIQVNLVSTTFNELLALPVSKWQMIWLGLQSWGYVPDYYPTGGGLFKTGAALNGEGYSNSTMNTLIQATYESAPTPQISQQRMDQYQAFASQHLPVLWAPYAANFYVSSKNLQGSRKTLNLISGLLEPQYWTVK